ncbi:MAG: hypothetical protein IT280_10050 [Ignavibacteria bacterium]|nr:hypothetical protein [Ignavibacteria bacterium]
MKKLSILFFIFILTTAVSVFAQPKVTLNLIGGYGVPLGDFKVDVPTTGKIDSDDLPYYTKQLITFGADGKLAIGKKGNFRVVLGLNYNMFSNNSATGTFKLDTINGGVLGESGFKSKVNILSINLGGEWAFSPNKKINPFVGVRFAANFFSGKFEFDKQIYSRDAFRSGFDMKSETRIGFIFDAGIDFKLSKQVGAIVGVNYHMINPLGKGADDESEVGRDEIDLGDKEHVRDNGTTSPNKSLSSINGYVGVSFYFGTPKTVKKK